MINGDDIDARILKLAMKATLMVELGNQKRLGFPDRSCAASVNKGADGRTYPPGRQECEA